MNVIFAQLGFDDIHLLLFAQLPKDFPYVHFQLSIDDLPPVFRRKDYMVLAIPLGMC